jgi:hypothetical protein
MHRLHEESRLSEMESKKESRLSEMESKKEVEEHRK